MQFRLAAAIAFVVLVAFPSSGRARNVTEHDVSVHMALTIAQTALEQCGVKASVAVVDRTGRLRVFLQGDGAAPHNIELARRKAYTALTALAHLRRMGPANRNKPSRTADAHGRHSSSRAACLSSWAMKP